MVVGLLPAGAEVQPILLLLRTGDPLFFTDDEPVTLDGIPLCRSHELPDELERGCFQQNETFIISVETVVKVCFCFNYECIRRVCVCLRLVECT